MTHGSVPASAASTRLHAYGSLGTAEQVSSEYRPKVSRNLALLPSPIRVGLGDVAGGGSILFPLLATTVIGAIIRWMLTENLGLQVAVLITIVALPVSDDHR